MHPPDPETRRPATANGRPNRKVEALNNFNIPLSDLQAQQLHRRFALALPYAELVARLHYARAER